MRFIRDLIQKLYLASEKNLWVKKFKPLIEATDEFFFSTDKTTAFAPHIVDHIDIKRYMSLVVVALIPATLASIYFFGWRMLLVILTSYAFGGLIEVIFAVTRRKQIHEGFLVTGLIFALILPPTVPLWIVAVGVMFGVFFGKEVFGGTGRNIFNPALVGRVFVSLAFPKEFTTSWQRPFLGDPGGFLHYKVDSIVSATPLIKFRTDGTLTGVFELLMGQTAGSIGETFRIALLLGGLFLILAKIIDWRIPLSYLMGVVFFAFLGNKFWPQNFAPALFQILTGGFLFGCFFMATDPVTSPFTRQGRWVYGVLLGLLTVLIRGLSGFVEGVMFSILLMNAFSPLIDHIVVSRRFKKISYGRKD